MNKQALAFLTLFSLILMLSVYYVTLPNDITAVISEETQQESTKMQTIHHQLMRKAALQCRRQSQQNLNEQINAANGGYGGIRQQ